MSHPDDNTLALDSPGTLRAARRESLVERGGWFVGAVVLAVALAGYLGPGPLGWRRASTGDGRLAATYYAVERYEAPCELKIWLQPAAGEASPRLAFSRSFTDQVTAESITPEPVSAEIQGESIVYTFRASDVASGTYITFRVKHNSVGRLKYRLMASDERALDVAQFVVP